MHQEHRIVCPSGLDLLKSPFAPHLIGAEVGVTARCAHVALNGFSIQRGNNPKVFTDTVQKVAGHPQMIPHFNPLTRADLELPLIRQKHQTQRAKETSEYL